MKKIAIFQSDLAIGGIQRSLINLLNQLDYNRVSVDLFLFDRTDFYHDQMPQAVKIIYLRPLLSYANFIPFDVLKHLIKQKKVKGNYDLAIDFNGYRVDCALGALTLHAKQHVIWIHNDYFQKRKTEPKYRLLYQFSKAKFKHYDQFIGVSLGVIASLLTTQKINEGLTQVIPNFINTDEIIKKSKEVIDFDLDSSKINLVSVGRLVYFKGFDLLLEAFKKVIDQRKDFHLYIIGDGPDKAQLIQCCSSLHLDPWVSFLGRQANPFPCMVKMDAFVLDSRYEGQGMVILEAKTLGLPVIMPKRLEKYNDAVVGTDDIVQSMLKVHKQEKKIDHLEDYNQAIKDKINRLFGIEA